MSIYIDAENREALEKCDNQYPMISCALNAFFPTEDVELVVHAHWIKDKRFIRDDGEIYDFCCSRCHGRALRDDYDNYSIFSSFCPTCGAKMDEEMEEDAKIH